MFKNFPNRLYDYYGNPTAIKDFYNYVNLTFKKYNINNNVYQEYIIQDGDTPESISLQYYQSHEYWYLILMINNKKNPFYDWPLTNDDLLNYAIKYVTTDYWEIQYQDPDYNPVDPTNTNDPIVNNKIGEVFTELERENDVKRHIFLPSFEFIVRAKEEYMRITSKFEKT